MQNDHIEIAIRHALSTLGIDTARVEFSTVRTFEGYYDTVDNIWRTIVRDPESVEILGVDRTSWTLRDNWSIDELEFAKARELLETHLDTVRCELEKHDLTGLPSAVDALGLDKAVYDFDPEPEIDASQQGATLIDEVLSDLESDLERMPADKLAKRCPDLYEQLVQAIWAAVDDLQSADLEVLFDEADQSPDMEGLAYWTRYFEPRHMDVGRALKCGLIPFRFTTDDDEKELLALGGAGMDLSPKLDAYQALSGVRAVPADSMFIRQPDYAKHVVGEAVFNEVMAQITTPPVITVATESASTDSAPRTYVVEHSCGHREQWLVPADEPVFTGYNTAPRPNVCPQCGHSRGLYSVKPAPTNR